MSVFTTQGYRYRLTAGSGSYANRTILDTFSDEEIKVSNNITELFDIGAVPGTFTRTISLPGTKKNNAFFQQYYDISVESPDLFSTNQKVEAYLDFDGIYLVTGYIQLMKVSVYENKYVDHYEVNMYGIVSNFSTDAKQYFLTDLSNLAKFNHTSSVYNIQQSWTGSLFSGSIVYALTDSGTGIYYSLNQDFLGIDDAENSLSVQDFKPAIKLTDVWNGIFDYLGYTWTGSFANDPTFNKAYLLLNNAFKYPVYSTIPNIDTYGQFRVTSATGSSGFNVSMPLNTYVGLPMNSAEYDYNNVATLGSPLTLNLPKTSALDAKITLIFRVTSTGTGSGAPAFYLKYVNANDSSVINTQVLANINVYLGKVAASRTQTVTETFNLPSDFRIPQLPAGVPVQIYIEAIAQGGSNFTVTLNPLDSTTGTTLEVKQLNQAADFEIFDIPANMPYGTAGIRLLDFVRGIQKKFNLVMYEDRTVPNQFIVQPFNDFYISGKYQNFNKYINLDLPIEFIPASTLAVNRLNFTDTQDTDYVSTLWQRTYNRTFGEAVLIDSGSYFSQGTFDVTSTLASGPLTSVPGATVSGSGIGNCNSYQISFGGEGGSAAAYYTTCAGSPATQSVTPSNPNAIICAVPNSVKLVGSNISWTLLGTCSATGSVTVGSQFPMYIPYYITNDPVNTAARVMPRLFFYNGQLPVTRYNVNGYFQNEVTQSRTTTNYQYTAYPYFDNYSVVSGSTVPTTGSLSLLYNNETPSLGTAPVNSLIDTYWQTYLSLIYNPRTRLVNAAAVIPLADYFSIQLNDVVQFRSNYYQLRAINDYNLTTGECIVQLLGPTIPDAVSNVVFGTPTPGIPGPTPPTPVSASIDYNCDFSKDFSIPTSCSGSTPTPTGYYYNLQQLSFICAGGIGTCTGNIGGNFIGYSTTPLVVNAYYNEFGGQVWTITGTTTLQAYDYNISSWVGSNYANCGDACQC